MQKYYRKYIQVSCLKCSVKWQKREDAVKQWNGHCRKCSYEERNHNEVWKHGISKTLTGKFKGNLNPRWVEPRVCVECSNNIPKSSNKETRRCKACFNKYHKGAVHWNWKGGATDENKAARRTKEYKDWAKAVKDRDDYTCQICNKRGGELHSDHIKPFCEFKDLRYDINNGRTLCADCHYAHGWSLFKIKNPRYKRVVTHNKETVDKIRISNLGQKRTKETKRNISEAREKYFLANPACGYHILCLNNYKVYRSISAAANALKICSSNISRHMSGELRKVNGYSFQKLTEDHLIF